MTKQRVNLDIDRELWKRTGIKALEDGITKRELVERALQNYINKRWRTK